MKNPVFLIMLCVGPFLATAQYDSTKVSTKLETFQSQRNKLFQKEWVEIGKVRNFLTVQILNITDLTSGDKISGLSISWASTYTVSNHSFLDIDEVEDLKKSIARMTTFSLSPPPANYTEIQFQSKDFEISIFPNNQNKTVWKANVKDLDHPSTSSSYFNADDLSKLQALITIAEDKLKKLK